MCVHVQDPVVFSGTVRDNLDPFNASQGDAAIWSALRQTGMADVVKSLQVRHIALCCLQLPCTVLDFPQRPKPHACSAPKTSCLQETRCCLHPVSVKQHGSSCV